MAKTEPATPTKSPTDATLTDPKTGAPVGPKPGEPDPLVAPDGTKVLSAEERNKRPADPTAPMPNAVNQPTVVARLAQQAAGLEPKDAHRPMQLSHAQRNMLGRIVLFNTFEQTDKGERFIKQRPAMIVDCLDIDATRCDLIVFGESQGFESDVLHAVQETTAADRTWSHATRF